MTLMRVALVLLVAAGGAAQEANVPAVTLAAGAEGASVMVGGETFFAFSERKWGRPVVWPLRAAGDVPVTRSWPMQQEPDAEQDHPHQRSLWFAHGDVHGVDFWTEGERSGRIEPEGGVRSTLAEDGRVTVQAAHRWVDVKGALVCTDTRTLHAHVDGDARLLAHDLTLRAMPDRALHLGDTKEGTFGLRLHPALRLEGKVATGQYRDSEGRVGRALWGKRARWIACTGNVGGRTVTVVLMDHPDNLRHPTWWHARPYGLLAANPFGVHDFEKAPPGTGDHDVPAGGELRLRHAVWTCAGDFDADRVEAAWRAFAR